MFLNEIAVVHSRTFITVASSFRRHHGKQYAFTARSGPGKSWGCIQAKRRVADQKSGAPGTAVGMAVASFFKKDQLVPQGLQESAVFHRTLHATLKCEAFGAYQAVTQVTLVLSRVEMRHAAQSGGPARSACEAAMPEPAWCRR